MKIIQLRDLLKILSSATPTLRKLEFGAGGTGIIPLIVHWGKGPRKEFAMTNIINLTPHTINICNEDGTIVKSFESKGIARAKQTAEVVGNLDGVELVSMKFGEPEDLPEYAEGTYYVVSIITANAAKAVGRRVDDLLITADPVRDADGRIIGCKRFALV